MLVVGKLTKKLNKLFILLLIPILSCTNNLPPGIYVSRFPTNGFFIEKIKLNHDKTFEYKWGGDLMHYENIGTYTIKRNDLILNFNPIAYKIDTIIYTINGVDVKLLTKTDSLFGNNGPEPSTKYLIKRNKLRTYNLKSGKVVKKAFGYSKIKKFIFFGSNYKKKKYYLKRVK